MPMKKTIIIFCLSIIHAIASFSLLLASISQVMHRFDTGELPSIGNKITDMLSMILLYPIFYPILISGGAKMFPGKTGYIILIINSFIWAIAIYWIFSKISVLLKNKNAKHT